MLDPVDVNQDGFAARGGLKLDNDRADQLCPSVHPIPNLMNFWLETVVGNSKWTRHQSLTAKDSSLALLL